MAAKFCAAGSGIPFRRRRPDGLRSREGDRRAPERQNKNPAPEGTG